MLIGIITLLVIVGSFLFGAGQWLEDYTEKQKLSLAISLPENGVAEQWMLSILENMDSVKENCKLIKMTETEALSGIENGSVYGAVIIPEGFVKGIMTGENLPADIYLPDSPLQKDVISLLTKAGAESLASAQAGIYAMTDFLYGNNLKEAIPKAQEALNREYMSFSLKRSDYFRHISITDTNSLPITKQYASAGLTLFLLLSLIAMAKLLESNKPVLETKLRLYGLTPPISVFIQTIVVFKLLSVIALAVLIPFLIYCKNASNLAWAVAFIPGIAGTLAVSFTSASLGVLVYRVAKSQAAAMLFLFLISVAMIFASGGFLPLYLLPPFIAHIALLLPTTPMIKCMAAAFSNELSGILPCLAFGFLFLLLSMVLHKRGAARK